MSMRITLIRDVPTSVGTFARGQELIAVPAGNGDWLAALPGARAVLIRASNVRFSKRMYEAADRRISVCADYRFAREVCLMTHEHALRWLAEGYRMSMETLLTQLKRWRVDLAHKDAAELDAAIARHPAGKRRSA